MQKENQNERAVRRCVELFNKCSLEWVDSCYAEEADWIELPIPGISTGRHGKRAFLRETARNILRLYPDRQLRILNLVAQDDQVVLEQEWLGTAAADYGGMRAGTTVHFRVASFFRLEDGLITKQTDYCIPIPEEATRN
jgi:ketosteroid isomerase-like protein